MIHNSSLSEIQKQIFQEFSHGRGETNVIEWLEFSDANYKVAWSILRTRYETLIDVLLFKAISKR